MHIYIYKLIVYIHIHAFIIYIHKDVSSVLKSRQPESSHGHANALAMSDPPVLPGAPSTTKKSLYPKTKDLPRPPNVALLRALSYLLDGIWGLLKGNWGVLVQAKILGTLEVQVPPLCGFVLLPFEEPVSLIRGTSLSEPWPVPVFPYRFR